MVSKLKQFAVLALALSMGACVSREETGATGLFAPAPDVSGLTVTAISASQIDLSWSSGGGTTSDYRIAYALGASAPADCDSGTQISETSITGTTHSVTLLTDETQYSFRVCAINANPIPDVSEGTTGSATTWELPPNNPTNLVVTTDSNTEISLTWNSGGGTTAGYRIAYTTGASAPATCAAGTTISESSIVGTAHTVSGLDDDTQYSFRVCSINSNPTPDVSSGATGTATTNQDPPPDPSNLNVTVDSTTQITLTWDSGGGSTADYRIAYATGAVAPADCASGTQVGEASIDGTDHVFSPLNPGTLYSFRVCAINSNATVDVSAGITGSGSTPQEPPPDPSNLALTVHSNTEMIVSWNSGGGSTQDFRISYQRGKTAPANCSAGTSIGENSITGTDHLVTGLHNGYEYSFRVCAINGNGTPDVSSGVTATQTVWWDTDWGKRRELVFDNSSRSEDLNDFPVLVVLDSDSISYNQTQDAGEDLRFVDADSDTELNYEIETWNESGTSYVWVKVPQITGSATTDSIWMYYGNAGAAAASNSSSTFDGNHQGVWHLNDDPTLVMTADATANLNDGAIHGDVSSYIANLFAGNAFSFDGAGDKVRIPQSAALDIAGNFTVEGWFRLNANFTPATVTSQTLMAKHVSNDEDFQLTLVGTNFGRPAVAKGSLVFKLEQSPLIAYKWTNASYRSWIANRWYHFAVTCDASDNENNKIYIDGVNVTDASDDLSGGTVTTDFNIAGDISFGGGDVDTGQIGAGTAFLNGQMDEIRISDTERSADWISGQYDSMTDSLITFGQEEDGP